MIVHAGEVWLALVAAFILGCVGGALLFVLIERSPLGIAQWAVADALGRLGDRLRDRLGMAPVWRQKRRPARRVAVAAEPDSDGDEIWDIVAREVEAVPAVDADLRPSSGRPVPGLDETEVDVYLDEDDEFDDRDEADARDASRSVPLRLRPSQLPSSDRRVVPPPLLTGPISDPDELDGVEIRRPAMLAEPRNGVPDNLQRIKGIGERNEVRLNNLGIFHFSQIAAWTPAEIRWIGERLAFAERIERDDWVGQAIVLASGGETGFTKAAERRRARRRTGRDGEDDGDLTLPEDES